MSRSLESALDEERQEVMNILEGRPAGYRNTSRSIGPTRPLSPVAPVRSMLDIGPSTDYASVGSNIGLSSPLRSPSLANMPSSPVTKGAARVGASPTEATHRSRSDASAPEGARKRSGSASSGQLPFSSEQFGMASTVSGQAMPKRVTLGGKRNLGKGSMATIIQGQDMDQMTMTDGRGRHNSTAGILGAKSKSPSSRLSHRAESPTLNTNSFNPMQVPGQFVTDSGKIIDMNTAFRKLSDANLLKQGGELSAALSRDAARRARARSAQVLSPTGEVRLQKDFYDDETGDAIVDSSDEDKTSDEDAWGSRGRRGRRRLKGDTDADNEDSEDETGDVPNSLGSSGPRKAKSLLAAAEQERISITSQHKIKSLLGPTIDVIGPGGEKLSVKKAGVHPNTNYNAQLSRGTSPGTSDSEELNDIRRAQKLSINLSPVDSSIPHRVIRTVIRGEFSVLQKEAEEGTRRLRTYLVATDLSAEAAYALEWTIGTVLRDGDTLLAVYAVDEEVGTGKAGELDFPSGLPVGEGGLAMHDTAAVVGRLTAAAQNSISLLPLSPLSGLPLLAKESRPASTDSRNIPKAEQERFYAIEDISQTCIKFLRKTRLQVRVAVEVIHCKSPKHMITEAIDTLEPTLVVLGSRGRSALKGVLLGSFSNYLVAKSSVPVMVARRKLQKPNTKSRVPHLANNLTPTRSLAEAKID